MGYFCFLIMLFLIQYSWVYLKFDVYMQILKELHFINIISNDDFLQQQKLFDLSKKHLISSLTNLALLMLWISPFIFLYFTFGKPYFFYL
jgi:hypothetical protein